MEMERMFSLRLFLLTILFLSSTIHGTTESNEVQKEELLEKKDFQSQITEDLNGRATNFKSKEDLPPEAKETASKVKKIQDRMNKLIHTVKGKFRKEIPVPDTTTATPVKDSPGLLQKAKDRLKNIAEKGASAKKKITDTMSDIKNSKDSAEKKLTDIMSDLENSKDSKVQEIKDTMNELLDAMKEKYRKGSFQLNTDQPAEDMLKEAFEYLQTLRKISTTIICVLSLICVGILVCGAVYRTRCRKTKKDEVNEMEQGTS